MKQPASDVARKTVNGIPTLWAILVGTVTAVLLCLGFVGGFLSHSAADSTAPSAGPLPLVNGVHATATSRTEKFVMATGPVEGGIEAVFILDTLSGDLQCTAFNSRSGGFNAVFGRNILQDLKVDADKRPEFLMVTGQIQLRNVQGLMGSPLTCVAYVIEANSGNLAAYAVPWNPKSYASGRPQKGELILLQTGSAKTAEIRE